MKPGATAWPSASIVFVAVPDSLPISAILPSLTPTSPRNAGIPEPSTTTPFLISKSYAIGFLLKAGPRRRDRFGSTLPRNFPAKAALSQHGSGPSHAKGHTERRQGSIHPCCPPSGHAALPLRPRSARVPVRIALRGAAPEPGHGAVERYRDRARRQHQPVHVRP